MKGERGASLIEALIALALLGVIGVSFLGALATTSNSRLIADEHASARTLAVSQMEEIRERMYSSNYTTPSIPPDYPGYSANISVDNLRNSCIQKITITIRHHNKDITQLESYKVSR